MRKAKFFVDVRVQDGRPFVIVRAFNPSNKKTPRARCTGNFVINIKDAHADDMSNTPPAQRNELIKTVAISQIPGEPGYNPNDSKQDDENAANALAESEMDANAHALKFHVGDPCPECTQPLTPGKNPTSLYCVVCDQPFPLSQPDGNDIEDSADAAAQSELDDNNKDL